MLFPANRLAESAALSKGQDDGSKNADALNEEQSDGKGKVLTLCLKDKVTAVRILTL